ncbi:uncharacterized protein PgNI_03330, partial [Pyricularia grisea]|uniref:Uncharacterized protein n=1 Tax=Pyricularia grisea TaxID=148305 RepID=A0A6P8B9W3_PYRGI
MGFDSIKYLAAYPFRKKRGQLACQIHHHPRAVIFHHLVLRVRRDNQGNCGLCPAKRSASLSSIGMGALPLVGPTEL